ncbi:MAG: rhomboid family intramembrane serine protease [Planctomycetota bacterium]|nr:rhomboid family intramembrane serine protease [Planctomycetota bacterium]
MRYQNYGGGFRGPSGPQMRFPSLSDVKYTKMFLIACLVMYGLQWVGLVIGGPENDFVTGLLSLKPKAVFESFQIWRLFTFAFLHDPRTPLHILFNLLVLYFFCPSLERAWGPKRFLSFMLYSILVPGIIAAFFYFSPSEDVTVIGASGVVFAALTAYAFLWPTRQILLFFIIPVPVLPVILVLLGIEVISMLQDIVYTDKSNVAHIAHVRWCRGRLRRR